VISASEDSWRWPHAQVFDAEGKLIDLLPADCLVSLPYPSVTDTLQST
jgi:hypothetical protein